MPTRREFVKTAAVALPLASLAQDQMFGQAKVAPFASRFNGVQIGVQTYSYRELRNTSVPWTQEGSERLMDQVVASIVQNQINMAEFWIAFAEPPSGQSRGALNAETRAALRKWRSTGPFKMFENMRKKFNDAGITIYSGMFNFSDDLTDEEIDYGFEVTKALGANIVSANCTRKSIKRAAPFADKHKLLLAAHSENAPFDPDIDGMVFGNNLVDALEYSPNVRVTLDTGHFTAYNGDALKFLMDHHDKVVNLHLKDRLKNHPEPHTDENTTEWGKGDAPLKEVLQYMKQIKATFAASIEYEYPGKGTAVQEVQKCLDYAKAALA